MQQATSFLLFSVGFFTAKICFIKCHFLSEALFEGNLGGKGRIVEMDHLFLGFSCAR